MPYFWGMEYGELVYACALSRIFNYNCSLAKIFIDNFPVPSEVFSLTKNELKDIVGRDTKLLNEILNHSHLEASQEEILWAESHGIEIIFINDSKYPYRLRECSDAPIILFYRGSVELNPERIVSIVGTRKASEYGKMECRNIIESLSYLEPAPVIISGLAYGIDITAHNSALEFGMNTLGIMATGLDAIYPSIHRKIAAKMLNQGGVISDFPRKTTPFPINFLKRNRIIAGMSDAVILIESEIKGGGVITSKMGHSYSKEVFALPGRINDQYSRGCNTLIRDNIASPILYPDSVEKALGWEAMKRIKPTKLLLLEEDHEIKRKILLALSANSVMDINAIVEEIKENPREVVFFLTELELEERIKADTNSKFSIL